MDLTNKTSSISSEKTLNIRKGEDAGKFNANIKTNLNNKNESPENTAKTVEADNQESQLESKKQNKNLVAKLKSFFRF